MARISDIKDVDVFETGNVVYTNNTYLNKKGRRAERRIQRRAWKRTYRDPKYMNHPHIRERSYSRLHSSSYLFDFALGNFRSIFIVFLLFIGFYMVAMSDNVENINPFESGISILQEISDMGHDAKLNMQNFVKSLSVWGNDLSWKDLNNNGEIWNGSGEVLKDSINGGVLTRLLKSIGYSFVAIFNFLKFIFRLIVLIFRVLGGIF